MKNGVDEGMTYLEYEPCSKFSGNVGVPDEKVDDPAHYPTARCLSGMHPRSEDHDLFPGDNDVNWYTRDRLLGSRFVIEEIYPISKPTLKATLCPP